MITSSRGLDGKMKVMHSLMQLILNWVYWCQDEGFEVGVVKHTGSGFLL